MHSCGCCTDSRVQFNYWTWESLAGRNLHFSTFMVEPDAVPRWASVYIWYYRIVLQMFRKAVEGHSHRKETVVKTEAKTSDFTTTNQEAAKAIRSWRKQGVILHQSPHRDQGPASSFLSVSGLQNWDRVNVCLNLLCLNFFIASALANYYTLHLSMCHQLKSFQRGEKGLFPNWPHSLG